MEDFSDYSAPELVKMLGSAIQFARDNCIRRPDAIIRDVAASLKQFRSIATKYGVSDEWTGRVETTIIGHLKAWGELEDSFSLD